MDNRIVDEVKYAGMHIANNAAKLVGDEDVTRLNIWIQVSTDVEDLTKIEVTKEYVPM